MNKIAFVSQSGNVMKSSLAIATAVECVKNDLSVGIADLDAEHRTVEKWLTQRSEALIDPLFPVYCPDNAKDALNCFNGESLQIIDAPSRATSATLLIAKQADMVILPTPPSKKDIDLTLQTILQLVSKGVDSKKLHIIFSRVGTSSELSRANEYMQMASTNTLNFNVLTTHIWERVGYRSAINDGYAITETPFTTLNDNARSAVYQLLANLLKQS